MFTRLNKVCYSIKSMDRMLFSYSNAQMYKKSQSLMPTINVRRGSMSSDQQRLISLAFNKFGNNKTFNENLILRLPFSTSSNLSDPGNERNRGIVDGSTSSTNSEPIQQSILGLLISLVKFVLNIFAAILRVLFHFVRVLSGQKGEQFIDKTREPAIRQTERLKSIVMTKSDTVIKGYEKSRAIMNVKIPQVKSRLDQEIPKMKNSLDNFNKRMDTELTYAKTSKEKRTKFYGILMDFINSNRVYQTVALSLIIYLIYKIFKIFKFLFW